MTDTRRSTQRLDTLLRLAGWGGAALLLLAPLVAMQITDDVDWTRGDFLAAALMLGAAGGAMELIFRASARWTFRIAGAITTGAGLFLVWAALAVGIVGAESEPVNLLYAAVLSALICGAVATRLQPAGMARTLFCAAAVQAAVTALALAAGYAGGTSLIEILGGNAVFILAFLLAAGLFAIDARARDKA